MRLLLTVDSEVRQMPMYRQVRFLSNALLAAGIKEEDLEEVATLQFWNPQKTLEAWLADHSGADLFVDDMDTFRSEDYDEVIQIGNDLTVFFLNQGLAPEGKRSKLFVYDYSDDLKQIMDTCPNRDTLG